MLEKTINSFILFKKLMKEFIPLLIINLIQHLMIKNHNVTLETEKQFQARALTLYIQKHGSDWRFARNTSFVSNYVVIWNYIIIWMDTSVFCLNKKKLKTQIDFEDWVTFGQRLIKQYIKRDIGPIIDLY